jgi:hypothetical protein
MIGAGNPGEAVVEGVRMGVSERANGASMGDSIGAGILGGASTLATGVNAFEGLSMESRRRERIAEGRFRGRYYDPKTGLVYTLRGDAVDINNKMQAPSGWLSPQGTIFNWATGVSDEQAVYKPKAKAAPKP